MPRPRQPSARSEAIPYWGRWVIGSFVGLLLFTFIIAARVIPRIGEAASAGAKTAAAVAGPMVSSLAGLLGIVLIGCLYFIPTLLGSKSPRVAAIFVANLVFGWTIIGWIIVLIWALAEAGSVKTSTRDHR